MKPLHAIDIAKPKRTRDEYLRQAREFAPRGQDLPQTKLLDLEVVSIKSAVRQREKLRQYIKDNLSNEKPLQSNTESACARLSA